jgi:Flp pilus assembly protein TadD
MQSGRPPRFPKLRLILLALTTLSACAASNPVVAPLSGAAPPRTRGAGSVAAVLIGRHALAEADMDVASEAYQRLLSADPDNADLQQRAFLTTLLAGRSDAVRVARQVPQNQAATLLLAGNDAREGNWRSAEARFSALPNVGMMELVRPLLIAWSQAGAGHPDTALAILRPLAEGQRLRPIYQLNAGMIADLAGNNAEAGRYYSAAHGELGGANLQMARLYASWLTRQGQRAEAEKVMLGVVATDDIAIAMPAVMKSIGERQVRQATDGIAEVYLALGSILRGQDTGDFPAVLLRLALMLKPDMAAARLILADIAIGGRHPEAALPILAPIGMTDPLDAIARMRRAGVLQATGKNDAALAILTQLARDLPGQPQPQIASGALLRAEHRYSEAVTAYDKAVALVPNPTRSDWGLFYERGIALDRDKQWGRAEADLQHALELYPDQPYVLNYLAYSWTEQNKNLPQARQMIERAAALRPNDGAIIDSLGWVVLKQGDVPTAVRHLERAVELESTDATITGHLGDAYWAAGRLLEAGFQWRRALALNPEPEDVPKLEAKIRERDRVLGAVRAGP